LLFQGKYLEAHVAIENATKLMHSKVGNIEHSDLEIYYLWLADSYERVGQYVLAEQHLLRAFKCAADESESAQIQFLFAQGRQQMGLGNFYTALESFEKVNEFYRVNNDEEKMIESFENLASCTYFLNQTERALIFVQKALELNVRLNGNQHRFVADDLLIQAFVYGSRKDFSKALESAGKARGIIQKIYSREHERMAYCCDCFGQIYVEMAKYKEAMSELNQSLKMRKSMYGKKAHPRTSVTYQNIGKVHEGLGEMNKAVEAYLNAITTWIGASCFEHPGLEECVSRILEIHKKKNVADALKKLHALLKTLGSDHALTKKVAVAMAQR
ncbi:MAG: tetratricopeptide repeat protein, partial [Parachlamydia sp.]|nr:tetratricopeptide repeat protein [Parachlamydia sp.]